MKLFQSSLVNTNDEELMHMVIDNNNEAFNELYRRYKGPIYSYLYRSVDERNAEELLQEIFIKIIKNKNTFKFESKFKTWAWAIARNSVIDFYRSRDHQMSHSFDSLNNEEGEEIIASDDLSLEEILLKKTTLAQLEICFKELTIDQKEALTLSIYSELSNAEVATMMKIKVGAVKSILFRSKEKLMTCFKRGGHL